MKKLKILLATENQNDITAWLRSTGAFSFGDIANRVELIRSPPGIQWTYDWSYFLGIDIVYFHRACTPRDTQIIERAKAMGCKVWVDHDDDLEHVTSDNPMYQLFSAPQNKEAIKHSILEADILTVGGERHRERLIRDYNVRPIRLYNALDDRLLTLKKPWKDNGHIAWRGSLSHTSDLFYFREEIGKVLETHKTEFQTRFFGMSPYWYYWKKPNVWSFRFDWTFGVNLIEYYAMLTQYNASFHFVPLIDTEFNRVKSNLAFLDATLAGSVVLGPNFEEFRKPGCMLYDENDFVRAFENMLGLTPKQCESHLDAAWTWIMENQLLSKVNEERLNILC